MTYPPYPPQPPAYMPYPAVPQPVPLETVFARAWALYRRNWIIALPLAIACVAMLLAIVPLMVVLVRAALSSPNGFERGSGVPSGLIASLLLFYAVLIPVILWAVTATYGMANAAWERGTATFADGNRAFRTRTGALIVAMLGVCGLAIVALVLALPTLFLSFLALVLFSMYVVPAVIAGRGGIDAIRESFVLVRRYFGRSAIGLLLLIALQYTVSFAMYPIIIPLMLPFQIAVAQQAQTGALPAIPPLGWFVALGGAYVLMIVLMFAYYGFYALALTGMYRSLAFIETGETVPVNG